jgi:hypothetical protein
MLKATPQAGDAKREDAAGLRGPALGPELGGLLRGMDRLAQDRTLYRRQVEALRRELEGLRPEAQRLRQELEATRQERAAEALAASRRARGLERDLAASRAQAAALRAERDRAQARLAEHVRRSNPLRFRPDRSFLRLPLVARSARGEFLGVAGSAGEPLCLERLAGFIQASASAARNVELCWERAEDGVLLCVALSGPAPGQRRELSLHAAPRTTPSGNQVAELRRLSLDGVAAPRPLLLTLFKQIRESFL